MARGFIRLMREAQAEVSRQSAREGRVRVFQHGPYRIVLTPDTGFFAVLLRPGAGGEVVKLLFSLKDLYLLGFLHNNFLYVYNDSNLGPGIDIHNHPSVRVLGFNGRHVESMFDQVHIDVNGLFETYRALLHRDQRTPRQIQVAMLRVIITVSEPMRFPRWLRAVFYIFRCFPSLLRDDPQLSMTPPPTVSRFEYPFSDLFRQWSPRSRAVQRGEAAFRPSYGCLDYNTLLRDSGVVLYMPRDNQA
ncbi:hypothetical protein QOZ80_2AG0135510 [Eleusine coracana subsp. coracana]|nr:hypothetical protein QOZ80_2AG0135510 [Eleusine coracana subsp. coracana]